ncbi:glycosyltransferase family 4 protein [Planctomicrobium sp. SH668]|uniref:glycosyltransferase family 4 protein n=1 Tax=Planctomicrobium sp. SH668 TaxID=3448126 RepID=UPI003F5C471C
MRVCLISLNGYPAIDARINGPIGGVETRSWTLARALATLPDTDVSLMVRHHDPLLQSRYSGVEIQLLHDRMYRLKESLATRLRRRSGFPFISLDQPRLSDLWVLPTALTHRAFKGRRNALLPSKHYENVPADVFVTFGVQSSSATVISSAHATGRKAVLMIAHDDDVSSRYFESSNSSDQYGTTSSVARWMLEHADMIVCQTEFQQDQLSKHGMASEILRNPIDTEEWLPLGDGAIENDRYALWIGRSENLLKQPMLLIELAKLCPEVQFRMIMNFRIPEVDRQVRAAAPENVTIIERVPFQELPGVMQRSVVFINTSSREGFPNTFLQAAASGVPIASLNVEGKFLNRSRTGFEAGGDLAELASYVRCCWTGHNDTYDPAQAREYVANFHSATKQAQQFRELLGRIINVQRG